MSREDENKYMYIARERRETVPPGAVSETRVRALELGLAELGTIKKLVGALVAVGLPAAGAFVYQAVVSTTRQGVVEEQVRVQAEQLDATTRALNDLRTELRVLLAEHRSAEQQRQQRDRELVERLQRFEARVENRGGPR